MTKTTVTHATLDQTLIDTFTELFVGRTVVAVDKRNETLTLDNEVVLKFYCLAQDCCAYATAEIEVHDDFQAAITDIEVSGYEDDDVYDGSVSHVNLALLHNGQNIVDLDMSADSGNSGYYFSTLSCRVIAPNVDDCEFEVVSSGQFV